LALHRSYAVGRRTYQRLKNLACFPEVENLIRQGETPTEIARFIQGQRIEYTDIQESSLAKIVSDYARENHPELVQDRRITKKLIELSEIQDEQVDVLQRLGVLASVQEQRVAINVAAELSGQRLIKGTREEIRTYMEILGKIGDRQDVLKGLGKELGTMRHVHALEGQQAQPDARPQPKQITESLNDPMRRQLLLDTIKHAQKMTPATPVDSGDDIEDAEFEEIEPHDAEEVIDGN